MKALIFALLTSASTIAFAQPVTQQIRTADVMFACNGNQPVLTSTPTLNVYSDQGGYRVANFGTNQVFLDGNNVIIQASSGEKSVFGTLKQQVSCQFDYDQNAYKPSWTNVVVNPALNIVISLDFANAAHTSVHTDLRITDSSIPHNYNMSWDEAR